MALSRNATRSIRYVLDELVPPAVRDSRWFMWLPMRLLFGKKAYLFESFKQEAPKMSAARYAEIYRETADVHLARETDLNRGCLARIETSVMGSKVLEAGCGRGFLVERLRARHDVTATDILISETLRLKLAGVKLQEADVEDLPFEDRSFDTVICTHTLEHVRNFGLAIAELRRVTRRRLIVVVPKQRPYRYTFDLHLHFFPHDFIWLQAIGDDGQIVSAHLESIEGDWYYQEERITENRP